ncbi:UDP-N-acetylglucosamine-N-acetylmuramylpentapeptide N-acetylglucosamine transferase [Marinospirillum celere]|uniref:UDP-N-acetylglucosamine--N-acetylmuramyl-(pentapeptide) pyrophosphoryl-undecaprenol N-acetylglucosamine transferase n=1 Tax=Marinospirillum celere TaxID=1122252 RepID=A0A1I1FYN7_9GAMM|nr:undecaprenyldiphospho-muramoylpentapeptide beta-N-acetylglucosaminyltransferase [Marinospirillum celere]SFC04587.1 UDP-N-acetylglucosamine-N-acetylmuramylpentapeptide N-acetylglucosamine transferase [Marinospirillum celere]
MKARGIDNLIMAGGTGGHIFPALALARALEEQGQSLAWLGSLKGMEAEQVPAAGIDFYGLSIQGLRGKGKLTLLAAPFRLLAALWQAFRILKRLKPGRVVGFGGFASGPGGLAARLLGIPLYIHEQNALPGLTNRRLADFSKRVFTAFPNAFPPGPKVSCIGNPVRQELLSIAEPEQRYADRDGPLRILVIGGSLGAQVFNQTLPAALALLPEDERPQVRHQAGAGKVEATELAYQAHLEDLSSVEITAFITDMAAAFSWADLVICRAGALTVSEVAAAGVASLLVPFPFAVDDHQTHNARFLADAGAGLLIPQTDFTAEKLALVLSNELGQRNQLQALAVKARQLAKPRATTLMIEQLLKDE